MSSFSFKISNHIQRVPSSHLSYWCRCTALLRDKKSHPSNFNRKRNQYLKIKHLKYCKIKAQAGQLQRERNLTKHLLWGQRDRILIAVEVEEALLTQATCFGGMASRARTTKTIFKDGTFIFVYKSLKCCVVRNYCLLSVLATSFFTFETKKRNLFNSRVLLLEG